MRRFLLLAGLVAVLSGCDGEPPVLLADGSHVPFDHWQDRWLIINYWAEWCAPCRIEIPMLNVLSQELSAQGVAVVGVNFDEDPRALTLEIAEELEIEFPVLTNEEVARLGLRPPDVLPTTYLLSPDGEVVAKLIGMQTYAEIREQLVMKGALLDEDGD